MNFCSLRDLTKYTLFHLASIVNSRTLTFYVQFVRLKNLFVQIRYILIYL